jgi:hypothetical protein
MWVHLAFLKASQRPVYPLLLFNVDQHMFFLVDISYDNKIN